MEEERTVNTGGEIVSTLLPALAGQILQDAAETPLDLTSLDPAMKRRKAIDKAHEMVQARWPNLFAKL
jgi:hypothetical protein